MDLTIKEILERRFKLYEHSNLNVTRATINLIGADYDIAKVVEVIANLPLYINSMRVTTSNHFGYNHRKEDR